MPTLSKLKEVTAIVLQDFPEIAVRYDAGDPTVVAPLHSVQHMLAELGRDVDISELEPFTKSRDATILADASNRNILPLATPCRHYVEVKNNSTNALTIMSGRIFEDGQGRLWRFLQTANAAPGQMVEVLAEQSEVRTVTYTPIITEAFHSFSIKIQDDLSLVSLAVKNQDGDTYKFVKRWMNTNAGEKAIILQTNSLREIILSFGDDERFGSTLLAGTTLSIDVLESYGQLDVSVLKEASLQSVNNAIEQKATIRFKTGGQVQFGADPLSIEQLRLLSSFPTYDDDATFLGNFDHTVRAKFMSRTNYICVWNEVVEEQFYNPSYLNINKMFVAVSAKEAAEQIAIQNEIALVIATSDNLYNGKVVFKNVNERPLNLYITGTVSPVHDIEALKAEIKTLLTGYYGKGSIAASYFLSNGFNLQEIGVVLGRDCPAFQDRTSDFRLSIEDISTSTIRPHDWIYLTEASIHVDIKSNKTIGESRWSIL